MTGEHPRKTGFALRLWRKGALRLYQVLPLGAINRSEELVLRDHLAWLYQCIQLIARTRHGIRCGWACFFDNLEPISFNENPSNVAVNVRTSSLVSNCQQSPRKSTCVVAESNFVATILNRDVLYLFSCMLGSLIVYLANPFEVPYLCKIAEFSMLAS